MTEVDGYGRFPPGGHVRPTCYVPGTQQGAAGPGLAGSYFFPAGFNSNQALRAPVQSSTTGQGVGLTVMCQPGRQYSAQMEVFQTTANTVAITVDGTTLGTSLNIPVAWTLLTLTFTASQPYHTLSAQTTGQALPDAISVDNMQLEPGAVVNAFTTTGPVIYPVMRNLVERWPRVYSAAGFEGFTQAPCVDAFAALNTIVISTEYPEAVMSLAPYAYWRLNDGVNTALWADTSGNQNPPLGVDISRYGAGTAPQPGQAMNIVGDPGGTGVKITGDPTNPFQNQLVATILAAGPLSTTSTTAVPLPPVIGTSWALTIAVWVVPINTTVGIVGLSLKPTAATDLQWIAPIGLSISNSASVYYQVITPAASNQNSADGVTNLTLNAPNLIVGSISQVSGGNTVFNLYINGRLDATTTVTTASLGGILPGQGTTFFVGGSDEGSGFDTVLDSATVAHVALWTRALSAAEVTTLWTAGGLGYAGETSGTRISRHLALGHYTGLSRVSTGNSTMQPATYQGTITLLTDSQNTTTAEQGDLWIAPDGALVFESRSDRFYRLTATQTLGENQSTQSPYLENVEFDFDPNFVYADVTVTRNGGATAVGGSSAQITTAIHKFFDRAYQASVDLQTDTAAQDEASWVFNTHSAPLQRVSAITLDPAAYPTLWPVALSMEVGNRVTVVRIPKAANAGAGFTMSQDYFVEQVTHDNIDMVAGTHQVTFYLSPIGGPGTPLSFQPGILDNATFGRLGTDGAQLHASVTSTATTATVDSTAGGCVFTTTAVPFAAVVEREVLTVTAVASTALDGFNRTVASGWGAADVGGAWTSLGGAAGDYAVAPSRATHTLNTVNVAREDRQTSSVTYNYVEATWNVQFSAVALTAELSGSFTCRRVDASNMYAFVVAGQTNSTITIRITKIVAGVTTTLGSVTEVFGTYAAATLNVRCQAFGSTLRMRMWSGSFEPTWLWQVSVTDTTFTAAGTFSFRSIAATGNTNVAPVVSYGAFELVNPQTFTLTRATDGTAGAHASGASVQTSQPFVLAF